MGSSEKFEQNRRVEKQVEQLEGSLELRNVVVSKADEVLREWSDRYNIDGETREDTKLLIREAVIKAAPEASTMSIVNDITTVVRKATTALFGNEQSRTAAVQEFLAELTDRTLL